MEFTVYPNDACLMYHTRSDQLVFVVIYVDDILMCSSTNALADEITAHYNQTVALSDTPASCSNWSNAFPKGVCSTLTCHLSKLLVALDAIVIVMRPSREVESNKSVTLF